MGTRKLQHGTTAKRTTNSYFDVCSPTSQELCFRDSYRDLTAACILDANETNEKQGSQNMQH